MGVAPEVTVTGYRIKINDLQNGRVTVVTETSSKRKKAPEGALFPA